MSEWCKKHEVEFDIDEGCRCCYSEWLIISEIVKDLKVIECHRVFGEDETLLDIILDKLEKWEKELK